MDIEMVLRIFAAYGGAFTRGMVGPDKPHPLIKQDLQMLSMPNAAIRTMAAVLELTGQTGIARMLRCMRKLSAAGLLGALGDRAAHEAAFMAAPDARRYDAVLTPNAEAPVCHSPYRSPPATGVKTSCSRS